MDGTGQLWNDAAGGRGKVGLLEQESSGLCNFSYKEFSTPCQLKEVIISGQPPLTLTGAKGVQINEVLFKGITIGCKSYLGTSDGTALGWWGLSKGQWAEGEAWTNHKGKVFHDCIRYEESGSLERFGVPALMDGRIWMPPGWRSARAAMCGSGAAALAWQAIQTMYQGLQ
jgi:hypothetical protein